jgi:hypothetical protein
MRSRPWWAQSPPASSAFSATLHPRRAMKAPYSEFASKNGITKKRKVLVIPHFCNIHYTKSWGEIQWGIDIKRLIILHKKMGVYG